VTVDRNADALPPCVPFLPTSTPAQPTNCTVLHQLGNQVARQPIVLRNAMAVDGLRTGTVRRIDFVRGVPQTPEVVDSGLQAPDEVGIWIPGS
jgi:hypothetical protein